MRGTYSRIIVERARRLGRSLPLLLGSIAVAIGCRDVTPPLATSIPDTPNRHLVTIGFDLVEVETGSYSTCGLDGFGRAYCWGHNFYGQVGNGNSGANELAAVAVLSPADASAPLEFTTISVGYSHACAVAKGGRVYCWGSSDVGQIGAGEGAAGLMYSVPTPITTTVLFSDISAGSSHSCALDKSGRAYCWGANHAGQLGAGALGPSTCSNGTPCNPFPRAVAPPLGSSDPLTFIAISAGTSFTCGVAKGGQVFCWGDDEYGQLGIGSTDGTDRLRPTPIASALLFTTVSAGADHACALAKGGALWCWGRNAFGEVGDGTTNQTSVPVPVVGGYTFTDVSAGLPYDGGEARTCAIAKGGKAYCWGDNAGGRLGIGFVSQIEPVPVPVAGGFTFTSITAGMVHGCGVTKASGAYCWGGNYEGQLGTGSLTDYVAPVPVSAPVP
jgi:alpha-tubulin suppressor-like RCC1 family protein